MACGWLSPAPGMVKLGSGLIGTREGTAQTGRDHAGWTEAPPRAQDLGQRPRLPAWPASRPPLPRPAPPAGCRTRPSQGRGNGLGTAGLVRAAVRELSLTRTASHGRPHTEPAACRPGNAPHAAELAAAARRTRGDIRRRHHGSESVKRWNDVSKRNKSTGRWDRTGRFADAGTDFPEPKTRRRTEGFGRLRGERTQHGGERRARGPQGPCGSRPAEPSTDSARAARAGAADGAPRPRRAQTRSSRRTARQQGLTGAPTVTETLGRGRSHAS